MLTLFLDYIIYNIFPASTANLFLPIYRIETQLDGSDSHIRLTSIALHKGPLSRLGSRTFTLNALQVENPRLFSRLLSHAYLLIFKPFNPFSQRPFLTTSTSHFYVFMSTFPTSLIPILRVSSEVFLGTVNYHKVRMKFSSYGKHMESCGYCGYGCVVEISLRWSLIPNYQNH